MVAHHPMISMARRHSNTAMATRASTASPVDQAALQRVIAASDLLYLEVLEAPSSVTSLVVVPSVLLEAL